MVKSRTTAAPPVGDKMAQGAAEGGEEGALGGFQGEAGKFAETETLASGPGADPDGAIEATARGAREGKSPAGAGEADRIGAGSCSPRQKEAAEEAISPGGRRSPFSSPFHDEAGELLSPGSLGSSIAEEGGDDDGWDTIPSEPASPALRGVHRIAVEVMRRSFGSADGDPGVCVLSGNL